MATKVSNVPKSKAVRHEKTGTLMIPVPVTFLVDADWLIDMVIEKLAAGKPYEPRRRECLDDASTRIGQNGLATKFAVDEAARNKFGHQAKGYVLRTFPELFELPSKAMNNTFLQEVEDTHTNNQSGAAFLLVCPVCGDRGQTTGSPSDDGTTFSLPLEGDCGHRWTLNVQTRNGKTVIFATT